MTPTLHRLPVGETPHHLALYDWGNPDASRVTVCVHGLTRNARDFDFLAQQLVATGRRVIAISMAGRGDTEWLADPMGYTYATYVTDCLAVLDNFHLREVEWVGTSMGGIIGMMLASQRPGRIRKLILNDIGARISAAALARIYAYVRTMPRQFADRAEAEAYLRIVFAPWGVADTPAWPALVESSLIARDGVLRYACDPAIVVPINAAAKQFEATQEVDLSPFWSEIQIPTLILHGADSDILDRDTITAMRATNLNTQSISFPGIGHAPALMDSAQTAPILEWLDRSLSDRMALGF